MTDVVIKIVEIVLILAPFAVFALIVRVLADLGIDVLGSLLKYCLTVVLGLVLMMFVVYPLILRIFTPVRYARFYKAISPAQLLALSSSSSGATMPVTMKCVEKRLGVSEDVTSFVIPVGATINMDGTALYQGVAAVFIAQLYGMDLTIAQQLTIVLTATLASIGTAAVPGVGIVMLVIVLESVGIPLDGIAVILGVDRILDMCRTSCNVTGDCMVAAVVAQSENELADEQTVNAELEREARSLDEYPKEEKKVAK
jgi:proton glutamate symport protein